MALAFSTASLHPNSAGGLPPPTPKHKHFVGCCTLPPSFGAGAQSEGAGEARVSEDDSPPLSGSSSSARTQLDLLEQLTSFGSSTQGYENDGSSQKLTIRDKLLLFVGDRDDDFILPLGKNLKKVSPKFLTVSQKRNIRRQNYLDEVSRRNDTAFFATIGAFVAIPPFIILGIAILTGYVQLLP